MQLQSHRMEKTEKDGAIPFASSYFFRRILVFEEATRKGSHAKKKKERERRNWRELWGVNIQKTCEQDSGNITQSSRRTSCGHRDKIRDALKRGVLRQAVHVRASLQKHCVQTQGQNRANRGFT